MSDLTRDEIIDILLNEMECVQRASDEECNRDCAKCDLLKDTNKILQAYRISIKALEHPEENVVAIVPCEDAISRQVVLDIVNNPLNIRLDEIIKKLPSVNPQEPKTGRWIDDKCSVCGKGIEDLIVSPEWYRDEEPNFCPFCGLRLVKPQESEGEK